MERIMEQANGFMNQSNEIMGQGFGKVFGYGRVSTKEQNPARQREALQNRCDVYFEDKMSGRNMERPEFKRMLEQLRPGDTVMVLSIDRLGRNTKELVNLFSDFKAKKINVVALSQGIDTSTKMGEVFYTLMAVFAQMELEFLRERQMGGIETAKKEGKYRGRPPMEIVGWDRFSKAVDDGLMTVGTACKLMKISRNTYYRRKEKITANTQGGIDASNIDDDYEIDY